MRWVIELQEFQFNFLIEESTRATLDCESHTLSPTDPHRVSLPLGSEISLEASIQRRSQPKGVRIDLYRSQIQFIRLYAR